MVEKDLIDSWFRDLSKGGYKPLQYPVNVVGEFHRQLGGMSQRALLELQSDNSDEFKVRLAIPLNDDQEKYFRSGIFGFLDIIMPTVYFPKKNVQVTLGRIEIHPVDSTPWAFREAGRDAGRKVVQIWQTWPQSALST